MALTHVEERDLFASYHDVHQSLLTDFSVAEWSQNPCRARGMMLRRPRMSPELLKRAANDDEPGAA